MKHLSLMKGPHHFILRYDEGCESAALDHLIAMVNDEQLDFDWFDAAVLSHQVGRELGKELKAMLEKKGNS